MVNEPTVSRANLNNVLQMKLLSPYRERSVHQFAGVATAAEIIQRTPLLCRRLASALPGIVLVKQGSKVVRHRGAEFRAHVGEIVVIPASVALDLINEPDEDGVYRALLLGFEPSLIRDLRDESGTLIDRIDVLRSPPAGLRDAIETANAAIAGEGSLPNRIVASRVNEILLWLASLGYAFSAPIVADPVERLRSVLQANPAHDWRASQLSAMLGMSEASLRRRLASAGLSLTEMIVDVRMSTALFLLQSTDMPITNIALDVGYDSASRFAARFRARFGFSPSEIRGRRRKIDRFGTNIDRLGMATEAAE
jgi:AraC-like DNA-binding protein